MAKKNDMEISKAAKDGDEALLLGIAYLNKDEFMNAINDPKRHRPLPYTLADIQNSRCVR